MEAGESSNVSIYNCTFENNSATYRGGALYSQSYALYMNASVLRSNTAIDGGAAYLLRVNAWVYGTQLESNAARKEFGGGMFVEDSQIFFSPLNTTTGLTFPCNFSNNTAQ
jgi:predicted outer membrane repeat protein